MIISLWNKLSSNQEQKPPKYKGINSVVIFNESKKLSNIEMNILLLGDQGVGKTTLFCQFLGENNEKARLNFMAEVLGKKIFVKILKIHEMYRIKKLQSISYDPELILLFFDVKNKQSFENVEKWISEIGKSIIKLCF